MSSEKSTASGGRRARCAIWTLVGAGWLMSWVWLFAFSYSDSYFLYSLCSRAPVFAAAMLGAAVIPVGAFLVWRRFHSVSGVIIGQVGVSFVSVVPLAATAGLLARVPGPCHLSGDDAMGAGIDFIMLSGAAAASIAVLAIARVVRSLARRRTAP